MHRKSRIKDFERAPGCCLGLQSMRGDARISKGFSPNAALALYHNLLAMYTRPRTVSACVAPSALSARPHGYSALSGGVPLPA